LLSLVGNGGEDILIAGSTDFDANDAALCAIMHEWTRCNVSYDNRIAHLKNGGGQNGQVRLNPATVDDDASQDRLTGSSSRDWFFANLECGVRDKVTDAHCNEVRTDID
jgi:hypothetical protein